MSQRSWNIPQAVFHMLKAARLAIEEDIHLSNEEERCMYYGVENGCNPKSCPYHIIRSDGSEDCLCEMLHDSITTMTEV